MRGAISDFAMATCAPILQVDPVLSIDVLDADYDRPLQPRKGCKRPLSIDFTPSPYSVICGRGKDCFESIGNRRFRVIVRIFLEQYKAAKTKLDKSAIVNKIVDTILSAGGGFVKYHCGRWWEVTDGMAREKVGAMIRDFLHEQYKSAAKSKLARRKELRQLRNASSSFASIQRIHRQGYRETVDSDDEDSVAHQPSYHV